MAEEDPIPRRRGTSTGDIDGFYGIADAQAALTDGDKAWGRSSYTMRSDEVYDEGGRDVTATMEEFHETLADCKATLIQEWENFEAAYNTIFANQETPGITELANLFATGTNTEFLPRVAGAVASAYNEAFGETAQIDTSQVADLAASPLGATHGSDVASGDLTNLNISILQKGAIVSDSAIHLKVLAQKIQPGTIERLRIVAEELDKWLSGTQSAHDEGGPSIDALKSFVQKLYETRYTLTEIAFGELHAGGLKSIQATPGSYSKHYHNDTTAPFTSAEQERKGSSTTQRTTAATHQEADSLTVAETRYSLDDAADVTTDAYGNYAYDRDTAIRFTTGEGAYIYPMREIYYDVDTYVFSKYYWERQLGEVRLRFQQGRVSGGATSGMIEGYGGQRGERLDLNDDEMEEILRWELGESGGLAEIRERSRVVLPGGAPKWDAFIRILNSSAVRESAHIAQILQSTDLERWGGVGTDFGEGGTVLSAFEVIGANFNKMARATANLEDCIYRVWDLGDRILKITADTTEAGEMHTTYGDALDFALTYSSEDRAANQEDLDAWEERGANDAIDEALLDAHKIIFREQCFLLTYIQQIAAWKKLHRDAAVPAATTTTNNSSVATPGAAPASAPPTPGSATNLQFVASRGFKRLPYRTTELNPDKGEYNASLLVDGDPYGFLNKLIQTPGQAALFNIENQQLSALQPMIRLFKIEYDNEGNEVQYEIKFDSNANNIEDALNNKKQRGFGVGIQSFKFSYEGTNPFAVKKSIKAQLNIFANSFTELFTERNTGGGVYKYADLALKTSGPAAASAACADQEGQRSLIHEANLSKLNFRLKAVVGWQPQGTAVASGGVLGQSLRNALYDSYATLELTPTIHNFEFDEMGRVTFKINYLAYVEDYFDDASFNIFTTPELAAARLAREVEVDYFSSKCDSGQISDLKKDYADDIKAEKHNALSYLSDTIIQNRKLYYIKLPYQDIRRFMSKGPFAEYENITDFGSLINDYGDEATLRQGIEEALSTFSTLMSPPEDNAETDQAEDESLIAAALLAGIDPESESLSFIFVSELIDLILKNLDMQLVGIQAAFEQKLLGRARAQNRAETLQATAPEDDEETFKACRTEIEIKKVKTHIQQFKKMRVLLGPVEFVNPSRGSDSIFVNFGDIPLSMRYLLEWISHQMLNKDEATYPLTKFLNDLFNNIIRHFLNNDTCFSYSTAQKVNVNQAVVTSYPTRANEDEITTDIRAITRPGISEPKRIHINTMYESHKPVLQTSGIAGTPVSQRPVDREMNYFIYFAGRTAPTEFMKGNRALDAERGIFHYLMGRDKGMIKKISLSKTDSKGLAEVRFEQDGYDGLKQLRVVYDVVIDTYADVKTYPGTYIFVNPQGFDPNSNLVPCDPMNLTQYGIGGYFMIWKSEHEFAAGKAETKIHAKWVNQVESEDCTVQGRVDNDQPDGTNCSSHRIQRFRRVESEKYAAESHVSIEDAEEALGYV